MAGMSNKISNVLGVPIPKPLGEQFKIRSNKNVGFRRNNDDIIYLANKTSWIRMVSSVQVINEDQKYFNDLFPTLDLSAPDDLAKKFVLFGGVMENINNAYTKRSGISGENAAYSPLGEPEINKYGYRPMPGITDASIETQGRLGSIRMATINFKVWDKYQLDVMDALYFKLGYMMFLEWGHTVYYDNGEKLQKSEYNQINPFESGIKKEKILRQIAENVDKTDGNYDGMLGMCTNFNFSYNQDGGFDCTVKIIALGALADSTKLNQTQALPSLNTEIIKKLIGTLEKIEKAKQDAIAAEERKKREAEAAAAPLPPPPPKSIRETFAERYPNLYGSGLDSGILLQSNISDKKKGTFIFTKYDTREPTIDSSIYNLNLGLAFHKEVERNKALYDSATIDGSIITKAIKSLSKSGDGERFSYGNSSNGVYWDGDKATILHYYKGSNGIIYPFKMEFKTDRSEINGEQAKKWQDIYKNPDAQSGYFYYVMDSIRAFFNKNIDQTVTNFDDSLILSLDNVKKAVTLDYGTTGHAKYNIPSSPDNSSIRLKFLSSIKVDGNDKNMTSTTDSGGITTPVPATRPDGSIDYKPITVPITFTFYEGGIIKDLSLKSSAQKTVYKDYLDRLNAQNTTTPAAPEQPQEKIEVSTVTEEEAQKYHSGLEYFIRSIQLYALTEFLEKQEMKVKMVDLYKDEGSKSFIAQAFANGVLKDVIVDLAKDPSKYKNIDKTQSRQNLMYAYASYGFNHNIMSTSDDTLLVPQVKFRDLFKAWAVPYKINGGIVSGTDVNYPVYIKLGLLLMIINHMCTIYDSDSGESLSTNEQVPLLYIDFNPETNICLSEPLQMSTDPLKFIIPWRTTNSEYYSLFDSAVVKQVGNQYFVGSGTEDDPSEPLFTPEQSDFLSAQLPNFKDPSPDPTSAYRGRLMEALVNTDYILNLCKNFASNNESQAVYLKPFLQQLINDLNKSLGDINLFRIAYSDSSNCLHIVDDQMCPQHPNEQTYLRAEIGRGSDNYTLPLFGVNSIAKSLSINTEVSSKLANMIAISANSDQVSDSGKDGSPFGHMNVNFIDRYKVQALSIGASSGKLKVQYDKLKAEKKSEDEIIKIMGKKAVDQVKADQLKKRGPNKADTSAAKMFNAFVRSCFSTDSPSVDDIGSATNYYIERMNKRKSENSGTRSSAMIPVSVEFKTDGIAGLAMGHAFALPDELLPNTYSNSFLRKNKTDGKRIGFVVIGLNHSLQGNIWETTVKANMIYLKDANDYVGTGFNLAALASGSFEEMQPDPDFSNGVGAGSGTVKAGDTGCTTAYKDLPIDSTFKSTLLSYKKASSYLKSNHPDVSQAVFAIMVAEAAKSGENFVSAGGYNYAGVQTDGRWPDSSSKYFVSQFCRVDSGGKSRMFGVFKDDNGFLDFMADRIRAKGFTNDPDQWTTSYINKWWSPNEKGQYVKGTPKYNEKLSIFNTAKRIYNSLA